MIVYNHTFEVFATSVAYSLCDFYALLARMKITVEGHCVKQNVAKKRFVNLDVALTRCVVCVDDSVWKRWMDRTANHGQ